MTHEHLAATPSAPASIPYPSNASTTPQWKNIALRHTYGGSSQCQWYVFSCQRPMTHNDYSQSALPIIDEPYTSPDEDPFSARSHLQEVEEVKSKSKRTSMLENWIKEQQFQPDAWGTGHPPAHYSRLGLGSLSYPYLAYPELPSQSNLGKEDSTSLQSYDLVEDSDIPSLASEVNSSSLQFIMFRTFFPPCL